MRRTPLATLQREVAAVLMDEAARTRWQRDPGAYARAAGLKGTSAGLLRTLDAADVAYYASRRWVDRWSFLAGDLPRATALARADGCLYDYFRAAPYPLEDNVEEGLRFAAWLRARAVAGGLGAVPCILPDLATYEATVAQAWMAQPPRGTKDTPLGAKPRRAGGVFLLELGHDLTGLVADDGSVRATDAPHARFHVAVVRRPGRVEPIGMDRADYLLAKGAAGRRTQAQLVASVRKATGITAGAARASLRELRHAGIVG